MPMFLIRRAFLFLFLLACVSCAAAAPPAAAPGAGEAMDGKWLVLFHGPLRVQLPIELALHPAQRRAEGTVLGNTGVHLTDGTLRGQRVRMRARTPLGAMRFEAGVQGTRLTGTWRADHLVGQFMFRGNLVGIRIPPEALAPVTGVAVFDSVWSVVDRRFYEPTFHGVDWTGLREEYRPRVAAASTDGEVVGLVNEMFARLGTSHLSFHPVIPPHLSQALAEMAPPPGRAAAAPERIVSWERTAPEIGYIRIASFVGGPAAEPALAALDSAFAELRELPSLIIDLRNNPGGHLDLGSRLANHLSAEALPTGYYVSREGLEQRGLRSIEELDRAGLPRLHADSVTGATFHPVIDRLGGAAMLMAGGGGREPYRGRVAVLINRQSYSAAEAVASAVQEAGLATLIGTRTGGGMLSSASQEIAPGWMLQLPLYDFRTAGGVRVEGAGVQPDIEVQPGRSGDPVRERAVQYLRGMASRE